MAPSLGHGHTTALAILTGLVCWEAVSRIAQSPFHPPLGVVLQAAWRMTASGEIPGAVGASLGALAAGYGLAAVAGVPLGLMLGRSRRLAIALDPYLDGLLAVPSLLLVPIFFGIFGLGRATQVATVFVYSFAVIATMTRSGLATLDPAHVDVARSFGASERQVFLDVLLPGSLPTIMAGLRLGIGRAVRALVNAEMLAGPTGLGALLRQYGGRFDAASVYGILVVLVVFALAVTSAVNLADRRLNRWTR